MEVFEVGCWIDCACADSIDEDDVAATARHAALIRDLLVGRFVRRCIVFGWFIWLLQLLRRDAPDGIFLPSSS